jgi:hypothetical protein
MRPVLAILVTVQLLILGLALLVTAQGSAPAGAALSEMVETERAFAQRSQEVGPKRSFLEFFVDDMRGFEGEDVKERIRRQPDPPAGLEFWWEPRYGDIASGELGWLTGPIRRTMPGINDGKPKYGNYSSVWKRQADGRFKVALDVGIDVPEMAPFAPGFTRVPVTTRYAGTEDGERTKAGLLEADRQLTAGAKAGVAAAYITRSHRMPAASAQADAIGRSRCHSRLPCITPLVCRAAVRRGSAIRRLGLYVGLVSTAS